MSIEHISKIYHVSTIKNYQAQGDMNTFSCFTDMLGNGAPFHFSCFFFSLSTFCTLDIPIYLTYIAIYSPFITKVLHKYT